jgi:hypothetical protein
VKEKAYFGQSNTDFDFINRDVKTSYERLKELKSEQEKLSKKVNKKVMGMIETAETEYEELTKKKQVKFDFSYFPSRLTSAFFISLWLLSFFSNDFLGYFE